MKIIPCLMILLLSLSGCDNDPRKQLEPAGTFGTPITDSVFLTPADVIVRLSLGDTQQVVVSGTISEYCKHEGCWLTLENPGSDPLLVEVENKLFYLPHHISGKTAVVKGKAMMETNGSGKKEPKIVATGIQIK